MATETTEPTENPATTLSYNVFFSLCSQTPLMISCYVQTKKTIGVVGGGAKHNGRAGVRGFRGFGGYSIDRDNFPRKCRMTLLFGVSA